MFSNFTKHFFEKKTLIFYDNVNVLRLILWNNEEEFWKQRTNVSQMTKTRYFSPFLGVIEFFCYPYCRFWDKSFILGNHKFIERLAKIWSQNFNKEKLNFAFYEDYVVWFKWKCAQWFIVGHCTVIKWKFWILAWSQ